MVKELSLIKKNKTYKNYPCISIITPSYNQGQFIEETIKSVLDQNYPNLDYLIIDGGSSDNSLEIIKKYEKYLSFWISEKDQGQSHALNKGLKHVTGDIFGFLNSDDVYTSGTLEFVGKYFVEHPDTWVLCGGFREIDNNGTFIRERSYLPAIGWEDLVLCKTYQPQAPTFWRFQAFSEIGTFREDLHYYFDQEFFIRLLKEYRLQNVDKVFSIARIHPCSKSQSNTYNISRERHDVILEYLPQMKGKWLQKLLVYRLMKLNYVGSEIIKHSSSIYKSLLLSFRNPILLTSKEFIYSVIFNKK